MINSSPPTDGTVRISLATNFDDALPELVEPYGVVELYGKLPADVVGGGRATFSRLDGGHRITVLDRSAQHLYQPSLLWVADGSRAPGRAL